MTTGELLYRSIWFVAMLAGGLGADRARSRGDVSSTVFFCTFWLVGTIALVNAS